MRIYNNGKYFVMLVFLPFQSSSGLFFSLKSPITVLSRLSRSMSGLSKV